jgi:hypothetical protein
MRTFQLEAFNRGKWVPVLFGMGYYQPTIRLSTIILPLSMDYGDGKVYQYETCLFAGGDSEVLERYETLEEAVRGHEKHRYEHGLR